MRSFLSYCNIVRLSNANKHLLSLYYAIYDQLENEALKNQLSCKIQFRNHTKREFIACLKNLKTSNRKLENLATAVFEALCQFNHIIDIRLSTKNWDSCYIKELENIELYYTVIYSNRYPKAYLDMIMKQKSTIEDLITEEV